MVSFLPRGEDEIRYYQVAETVRDAETREREYAPLRAIRDHRPKMLLTLDEDAPADYDGIRRVNALDFLLGNA